MGLWAGAVGPEGHGGGGVGDVFHGLPLAALGPSAKALLLYAETLLLGMPRRGRAPLRILPRLLPSSPQRIAVLVHP